MGMILMKNIPVEVLGRKGEWFKVKIGNGEYWIQRDYLTQDQGKT
jgi:hypothetical protein